MIPHLTVETAMYESMRLAATRIPPDVEAALYRVLAEVGGVFLSKIGVCGNLLAPQVRRVKEVHFLDELGKTEATWVFEVENFGPFFVAIDARGNSYFEDLADAVRGNTARAADQLGIPHDFDYTVVSAHDE